MSNKLFGPGSKLFGPGNKLFGPGIKYFSLPVRKGSVSALLTLSGMSLILSATVSCKRELLPVAQQKESTAQSSALVAHPAFLFSGLPGSFPVQTAQVNSVAGNIFAGSQNGQGRQAQFNGPSAVASDAAGNIYVADAVNNQIRKMTPDGTVSTFAGDGTASWKDGPALSAEFKGPTGLAFDAQGNLYIADRDNNRIRKISTAGIVTTLAGSDTAGFVNGSGKLARFSSPTGVAVDGTGEVYVADFGNNRIRRISTAGVVSLIAGNGTAGFQDGRGANAAFNGPMSVAISADNTVYIADFRNNRIRKISIGTVSTLAGSGEALFADGTGAAAKFDLPTGIATDAAGSLYVTDALNNRIRKLTSAGVVTTLAGNFMGGITDGFDSFAQFSNPWGITVDPSGNIYVADLGNEQIRKITIQAAVRTFAGSTAGYLEGTGTGAQFDSPDGVATDMAGNIYVADHLNRNIRKITPAGVTSLLAGMPSYGGSGGASIGRGIQEGKSTTGVGVNPRVDDDPLDIDGIGTAATFGAPHNLVVDLSGNVYVADAFDKRIRKITPAGVVTTLAGSGPNTLAQNNGTGTAASFRNPLGLTIDRSGNIYVADLNQVRKITPAGVVTTLATITGPNIGTDFQLNGITMDAAGNLYATSLVASPPSTFPLGTIWKISTTTGSVSTFAGPFNGFWPFGITIDPATGNLYVTEIRIFSENPIQIWKFTAAGAGTVIAGGNSAGSVDGPDLLAQFQFPEGIALSPSGILYIADRDSHLIRMMSK